MIILYFITKSEQGGAQTHVAQLTEYLISHDHRVAVMSAPGGWLEEEVRRLGGYFYQNSFLDNTINPGKLWRAGRQFLKVVRDVRPDIVACHSTIAGLIGRYALRGRIPTIFTAHGWGFTQGTPLFQRFFLIPLERMAGIFAARIICVSQNDADLTRQLAIVSEKKVVKINNGVTLMPRRNHDRDKKILEIVFIGRLASQKNPLLFIEAIKKLPVNLQEKIHVSVIGDGPQKHDLQMRIKGLAVADHITFTGAIPRESVLSFLDERADIFVLTSRFEGFPYSILEAMSAEVPIIATDVGGIREAVGDDAGILISRNDADAFFGALATLIQDSRLRKRMGRNGRPRIERFFSIDTMCRQTVEIYEAVLSESFTLKSNAQ